ncbi:MAG TPA: S8/S53 family peptidase [Streptosporangiaceae bacterium]|nr:S8/S53 family peptidase [Streptosporangiaceae bacterium]
MTSLPPKPENLPTKAEVQAGFLADAFRAKGVDVGVGRTPAGDLDFLYEDHAILVRDAYVEQVRGIVGRSQDTHEQDDGFIDGVTLLSLDGADITDVSAAIDAIDGRLGVGVATPNHVLSICPVGSCPATEPAEVDPGALPDPGIGDGGGQGVYIYIADTGLLDSAHEHAWLAGVTGEPDSLLPADSAGTVAIPEYAGHGTFVAGVARCMAPASTVHVVSDLDTAGALSEHKIVKRLDEALGLGADIICLPAGGNSRRNLPPLGFEALWRRYRHHKGTVLVAAAGNNSSRRPFWPAAFPQVVGVGAIAANRRGRAHFSDFGPWVDVYAPGEDLVNAYATGTYTCREPPNIGEIRTFRGMARWSGSSFAAPLVAGLIAARMSRTGENGRQAADALLALARAQPLPGVGPALWPG